MGWFGALGAGLGGAAAPAVNSVIGAAGGPAGRFVGGRAGVRAGGGWFQQNAPQGVSTGAGTSMPDNGWGIQPGESDFDFTNRTRTRSGLPPMTQEEWKRAYEPGGEYYNSGINGGRGGTLGYGGSLSGLGDLGQGGGPPEWPNSEGPGGFTGQQGGSSQTPQGYDEQGGWTGPVGGGYTGGGTIENGQGGSLPVTPGRMPWDEQYPGAGGAGAGTGGGSGQMPEGMDPRLWAVFQKYGKTPTGRGTGNTDWQYWQNEGLANAKGDWNYVLGRLGDDFSGKGMDTGGGGSGGGPGGFGSGWNTLPTADQLKANPGFQYAIDEAQRGMQNSAAAKGTLLNGRTNQAMSQNLANYALGNFYLPLANLGLNYNQANQDNLYRWGQLGLSGSSVGATGRPA